MMIQSKNTTNTTNNNNNNNNNEEDEEEEEEDDDDGMAWHGMAWHGMSIQEDTRGYKRIQEDSAGARTSHHRACGIGRQ